MKPKGPGKPRRTAREISGNPPLDAALWELAEVLRDIASNINEVQQPFEATEEQKSANRGPHLCNQDRHPKPDS